MWGLSDAEGEFVPGLGCDVGEGSSSRSGSADASDFGQGKVGGADVSLGCVEGDSFIEVLGSSVVEGFVGRE